MSHSSYQLLDPSAGIQESGLQNLGCLCILLASQLMKCWLGLKPICYMHESSVCHSGIRFTSGPEINIELANTWSGFLVGLHRPQTTYVHVQVLFSKFFGRQHNTLSHPYFRITYHMTNSVECSANIQVFFLVWFVVGWSWLLLSYTSKWSREVEVHCVGCHKLFQSL